MIIFIYGPDTYSSHQRLKQLKDAFIKKHDPSGTNLVVIDGSKLTIEKLNSSIKAEGLLAKKRMVIVDELVSKNKKTTLHKDVAEYLKDNKVPEDTILVFYEGNVLGEEKGKKTKSVANALIKLLANEKLAEYFPKLTQPQLKKWVISKFNKNKIKTEPYVVDTLISLVGDDLWQLANEIEKLSAMRYGETVTVDDVKKYVIGNFNASIFSLTDALGNKDQKTALKLTHNFLDNGEPPLYILTMLVRQFRILLEVQEVIDSEPNQYTVAKRLGLHPFVAKKAMSQVTRFNREKLKEIYQNLADIDFALKTSNKNPALLFDQLIINACS